MERNSLLFILVVLVSYRNVIQVSSLQDLYRKKISGVDGTYYGIYRGGGHCSLDPLPPIASQEKWINVAAGPGTYRGSLGCGMCLEIMGSGHGSGNNPIKGKKKAVVIDQCAAGCGNYGLDLFTPGDGRWKISYVAINCPTTGRNGKIQFRFQGSHEYYIKLQARNTKIPTAKMEVQVNGKYRSLQRVADNFFEGRNLGVKLKPPLRVRLTAINGEQVTTTIPRIQNNFTFKSKVQFRGINRGR